VEAALSGLEVYLSTQLISYPPILCNWAIEALSEVSHSFRAMIGYAQYYQVAA
jgi:hypothetical protein